MNYRKITEKYYSMWAGIPINGSRGKMEFVYNPERDNVQLGYGNAFDLWIWLDAKGIIVSYGTRAKTIIFDLQEKLNVTQNNDEIIAILKNTFNCKISNGIKFLYRGNNYTSERARVLSANDYELYEKFYKINNPNVRDMSRLKEYFDYMSNICCGIIKNGILVCCADAPKMPYMSDSVQEIGVNTLTEYRGRHFASDCAALCVEQIIKSGKCPQWSCGVKNIPSQKIAERIGFVPLGEYICVTRN